MWPLPKPQPPLAAGRTPALRDLHCRPTGLGAGLAVMVGLLWLVGLNYQVNLAYAAAFWLAGFAMKTIICKGRLKALCGSLGMCRLSGAKRHLNGVCRPGGAAICACRRCAPPPLRLSA